MKLLDALLDALFPENFTCELCGREIFDKTRLCKKCKEEVKFIGETCCPRCGRLTPVNALCLECKAETPAYDKAVSAFSYEDGGQRLIHAYKNGKPYLKEYFADLLVEKCKAFENVDALVYVPMTKKAERKRGYNQAKLLAKALSKRLNIPLLNGAVEKVKSTVQQKLLTKREREENLKGCFYADKQAVSGKNLILVDDVMTTGATADAVTKELKKRGAGKIYFATVASVEFRGEI